MKNIFGLKQENEKLDGKVFITREIPEDLAEEQKKTSENLAKFERQLDLPLALKIVKFVSIAFAALFTVLLLITWAQQGFSYLTKNAGWAIVVAVCLWLTFFALIFIGRVRAREVIEEGNFSAEIAYAESLVKESEQYLEIPKDCQEITVFGALYKQKSEKTVSALPFADLIAVETYLFVQENKVNFADTSMVLTFDKGEITGCEIIDEKIKFHGWTKREHFTSEKYKKYKITADSYGVLSIKGCLHVYITRNGEDFKLLIPVFDAEQFLNAVGIKIN